jgi:hypothetical protein
MSKMLAAPLPGNSTVEMREIERPKPGMGQVLLKMKASGICGSDIHYIYHKHLETTRAPRTRCRGGARAGRRDRRARRRLPPFQAGQRSSYHISGCGRRNSPQVSRFPVQTRSAQPTAGNVTAALRNISWPTSAISFTCRIH